MGSNVYITRADHWSDGESSPITFEEWVGYLQDDTEMRRDEIAAIYGNSGLAEWTTYSSRNPKKRAIAWFDYEAGRIIVKNPDDEILVKMKKVAATLKANVIGDDGEFYRKVRKPSKSTAKASRQQNSKPTTRRTRRK